jgi:hypothetical protein
VEVVRPVVVLLEEEEVVEVALLLEAPQDHQPLLHPLLH